MLVLGINRILKWAQIVSGGKRYTCPTKEINGELFWYYKKRKCRTPTGVSHLRLFLYNEGSNWSGVGFFGAKPPT